MLVAGALPHFEHLARLHGGRGQRAFELSLLFRVAAALPGDERAALAQERRGELGEGRQARDRACGDGVVGLAALGGARAPRSGR